MRKVLLFTLREYRAAVKTKGFIIGLVIAPLMMSGSLIAFYLLKDRVDTRDKHLAVIDYTGKVAPALVAAAQYRNSRELVDTTTGRKVRPAYLIEIIQPNQLEPQAQRFELSDRVRNGSLHGFVEIGASAVHPFENKEASRISFHGRNPAMDDVRNWVGGPISMRLRALRLADAGIEESRVRDLFFWQGVDALNLLTKDEATGEISDAKEADRVSALLVPIIILMLMFLMIMMSVPGLLHSVMEEKTQRIAEVLLASIGPFEFMAAKVLGGIAVSLTSALVYVIAGVVAVQTMGYADYVPFYVLPWFFIYMILAITMFGAMSAALGSTCSEAKDAQALSFPVILPAIFPMFIYMPVAREPLSGFATWASLFPPFTPLLMVLRLSTPGGVPVWQPFAGLVGVLLCTLLFVWMGGRIFRVAILMQGTPPKLSNIVRWAIRG